MLISTSVKRLIMLLTKINATTRSVWDPKQHSQMGRGRIQQVVGGIFSEKSSIKASVRTLCFMLCINNIGHDTTSSLKLFAYDSLLFREVSISQDAVVEQ